MKRIALLIIILCAAGLSWAQNCNETTSARIKLIQDATNDPIYHNTRGYDSLKKEMYSVFGQLESCVAQNPSYEARAKIQKINLYFDVSEVAGQSGQYGEMLKLIEASERLIPSPGAISASSAASFTVNSVNYTSEITASYISTLYYRTVERRANYYYFGTHHYDKVVEWYEKIKNAPSDFEPQALETLLYADAMYRTGKTKAEYFPAMAKSAAAMGKMWAKKEEHDSAIINNRDLMLGWFVREMNAYNKASLNAADPGGKYRMLSAHGLWDVNEKSLAKDYALYAAQNGLADKAEGFWYLDILADGEAKHVVGALQILTRALPQLTEEEMIRLLPLAQTYHQTELEAGIRSRQRRIASLRRRTTISLVPAVELVGLPFGHVPVSLNLRTGRVWQEFRFDYVWGAKTNYRFGRFAAKDKGDRYEFTGWDVGYSFNYILGKDFRQGNKRKGRSAFYAPALGLDLRYVNWNFAPISSNVLNDAGQVTESGVLINAKTIRYEACYRISFLLMTRYVTIDYYLGMGIGYRSLSTAQGRDVEKEHFEDQRLAANRWNKIYMPLRLGLKIGLNFL